MKKYTIAIITLLFLALCAHVFGQANPNPFEVRKSGKGKQALIFIPGFACSGEVWAGTRAVYEKNYTCYTFTMAGFAGVPAQNNASFKNWETAIVGYIKANKIEHPIIIGHSMGGGLALALAADYPELVQKIVVVDALPCLAALMNPAFVAKENNDCTGITSQITAMTDMQFEQMQQKSMARLVSDSMMRDTVIGWSVRSDRATFAGMYCDFSNTDLRSKMPAIQCPALILLEKNFAGGMVKPAIDAQYASLKTADLHYADKGLHFIMYDDKDWYFAQLNKFIPTK